MGAGVQVRLEQGGAAHHTWPPGGARGRVWLLLFVWWLKFGIVTEFLKYGYMEDESS